MEIEKKLWPILILRVLQRHADEGAECDEEGNKYLTQAQILGFLEDDYDIITQRKAVADNLSRLYELGLLMPELGFTLEFLADERRFGNNVSTDEEMQLVRKGWRLNREYEFDTSEIRMLVDAVIASSVIPPKQAKQLIRRLEGLAPDKIVVPNIEREGHIPAVNSEFFLNIELLNEAIQEGKQVRFILCVFGKDKKLHKKRHDGEIKQYTVMPIQLLSSNSYYYLLSHFSGYEEIYKFRVDLIRDVEILESVPTDNTGMSTEAAPDLNILRYREQHSYMMSGKVMNVVLRVSKESLYIVFDQFGSNVHIVGERVDAIDVEVKSTLYSVLFWALQFYQRVEVLSPPELREKLEAAGHSIVETYAKN